MRIVAFAAVKGGVGKTTAAVNVAVTAARGGTRSLLWDLDPQAAACHLLDIRPVEGPPPRAGLFRRASHHPVVPTAIDRLSMIPADSNLVTSGAVNDAKHLGRVLDAHRGRFDLVVLDLPAGVDAAVEAAVHLGADIMVPIVPSTLSLRSYEQFAAFVRSRSPVARDHRRVAVQGFVSMADPTLKRHADFVAELRSTHPEILATWIPRTVELERASEQCRPVAEAFPGGRAASAFAALWAELTTAPQAA